METCRSGSHGISLDGVKRSIPSGAKQAAEEGRILSETSEKHATGPKGRIDFARSTAGVKTPTYQFRPTARMDFSAACKATPFQSHGVFGAQSSVFAARKAPTWRLGSSVFWGETLDLSVTAYGPHEFSRRL
jgi:hypothetical protein